MAVGGQPLGWVSELSRDYKLLGVPDTMVTRLAPVYEKGNADLPQPRSERRANSSQSRAMLVTRNYTSKSKHDQLEDDLRQACGRCR